MIFDTYDCLGVNPSKTDIFVLVKAGDVKPSSVFSYCGGTSVVVSLCLSSQICSPGSDIAIK